MACYSNEQIKEAKKQYDKLTADPVLRTILMYEELDELDRNTLINREKREARAEGHAEGRAEGHAEGHAEGRAEGEKLRNSKRKTRNR